MDKKDLGLLFVFLGAAMWVQAFTYAALNTAFVYSSTSLSCFKSFLGYGNAGSFICAVLCAVFGILLIKFDSGKKCDTN